MGEVRPIHRSNLPWPPRSSDLTLCDFFMWRFVKSKVYLTRPANIPELKDRTRAEFAEITVEMHKKAALAYRERLEKVIESDGVTSRCTAELKANGFVPNLDEHNPKLGPILSENMVQFGYE